MLIVKCDEDEYTFCDFHLLLATRTRCNHLDPNPHYVRPRRLEDFEYFRSAVDFVRKWVVNSLIMP
jgi:hypothetical protein